MKKILALTLGALALASCSQKAFYQVIDVKSTNVPVESSNYVYSDDVCSVVYDLWGKGGDPGFAIENYTDQTIYIDLANSFYIKNGCAHDYFLNRTYGKGNTSTVSKGASVAASVAKGLAATVLGVWGSGYAGSATASANASASAAVSTQVAAGSSSSISYAEKPILAIPPHSYKNVSEYIILGDIIQDCDVKLKVSNKKPEGKTYTEEDSPIYFTNYITYFIGDDQTPKVIQNDFYVAGFKNYTSKDVLQNGHSGCKGQNVYKYIDKADPTRFYIPYGSKHNNDYSADCKKPMNAEKETKASKSAKRVD